MVPRITLPEPPLRPPIRPQTSRLQSAKSIRSYQSSFEADDERSSSSSEDERMDGDPEAATHRGLKAEYPGEDTRLTSKNELAGWYCYGFAAEVFVICGMGTLISQCCFLGHGNGANLSVRRGCYLGGCAQRPACGAALRPTMIHQHITG